MAKGKNTPTEIETLEQALEVIEAQKKENAQLKADNDELQAIITDIRKTGASSAPKTPSFEFEGESYNVTAGKFNHNNQIFTAQDVCENPKLQAELIEMGVGFIQKAND